jgi:hypothetical protein
MKLGRRVKSPRIKGNCTVRLFKLAAETPGFVSFIVWLVAGDPTGCAGNVSKAGLIRSGCEHAVELPKARQM